MFGFYERSPYSAFPDTGMERRLSRKMKKMLEDAEFYRRFSDFIKENENKDKDKKDDKKKEDNKSDKVKDILATMFLLTFAGPFVGLAQLYLLYWIASLWQHVLPH